MSGLIKMKSVSCNWLVMVNCGLYKKKIILNNGIRFEHAIRNGEDGYFSIRYLSFCHQIRMINRPFYTWWSKSGSLSGNTKGSLYNFVNGLLFLCPSLLVQIKRHSDSKLEDTYASWVISNFNQFLNRASKCNLNYKEVRQNLRVILSQKEVLDFIYQKKLYHFHEKIARLMLKSNSTFITYVVIKAMRLMNGYWRLK